MVCLQVKPTNDELYTVIDQNKTFIVDLMNRSCTCNKFQVDEFPCAHVVAALKKNNRDAYQYCSSYYTNANMLAAYAGIIYPLGDKSTWNIPETIKDQIVLPPPVRPKSGRPRKRRFKGAVERSVKSRCGQCKDTGHNQRTCGGVPMKQ